jgi:hypothetical protein
MREQRPSNPQQAVRAERAKPYASPTLTRYGNAAALTQAGGSSPMTDDGTNMRVHGG